MKETIKQKDKEISKLKLDKDIVKYAYDLSKETVPIKSENQALRKENAKLQE